MQITCPNCGSTDCGKTGASLLKSLGRHTIAGLVGLGLTLLRGTVATCDTNTAKSIANSGTYDYVCYDCGCEFRVRKG